jgi:hypothetical protein
MESGRICIRSQNRRDKLRDRGCETLAGMKGSRPSASQRLEPDRALLKRTYSCRTSDRSPCLYRALIAALHSPSRDGRPSGRPMERGQRGQRPRPRARQFLGSALEARGRNVGRKWRPSVRDRNGASPSLAREDRRTPKRNERTNSPKRTSNACAARLILRSDAKRRVSKGRL